MRWGKVQLLASHAFWAGGQQSTELSFSSFFPENRDNN